MGIEPADAIADAAALFAAERAVTTDVDDRTIVVTDAVVGDPGLTVLRALGAAQDAGPVGAAAHGSEGVAIGVWDQPNLYVARWVKGRRRVTGFRLQRGARPNDYLPTEGRIPTRFETDNWYGDAPEAVAEAFLAVGLLLDEPPFPVPPPPPTPPPAPARTKAASRPRAPRAAAKPVAPKAPAPPTTRVCTACFLQKQLLQFDGDATVCIDCD